MPEKLFMHCEKELFMGSVTINLFFIGIRRNMSLFIMDLPYIFMFLGSIISIELNCVFVKSVLLLINKNVVYKRAAIPINK